VWIRHELEAKYVLANINRTQAVKGAEKFRFLSLVTLTFDLDTQTCPNEGPIKHVFPVNSAQIRSAIPDILHTQTKSHTQRQNLQCFRKPFTCVRTKLFFVSTISWPRELHCTFSNDPEPARSLCDSCAEHTAINNYLNLLRKATDISAMGLVWKNMTLTNVRTCRLTVSLLQELRRVWKNVTLFLPVTLPNTNRFLGDC